MQQKNAAELIILILASWQLGKLPSPETKSKGDTKTYQTWHGLNEARWFLEIPTLPETNNKKNLKNRPRAFP